VSRPSRPACDDRIEVETGGEASGTAGGSRLAVVVLAGGRGRRMRSPTPKHLLPLLGRRIVDWVIEAARALDPQRIVVVVSPGTGDELLGVELAVQEDARGTGDAMAAARPLLADFEGDLLVLAGDTPLLTPGLLGTLVEEHRRQHAAATVLVFESPLPLPYGRVVRDAAGRVVTIVEEADATPDEVAVRELNASVYVFEPTPLWAALDRLEATSTRGESRLPHAIGHIAAAGETVATFAAPEPEEVRGVNTPDDLAAVSAVLRARLGSASGRRRAVRRPR
jgi:bifunctional N-acetylglucosamine-1-phosphate-uridyltransferase/glucosamine-1-phosphate-acetyltransferase GlmU-like protein